MSNGTDNEPKEKEVGQTRPQIAYRFADLPSPLFMNFFAWPEFADAVVKIDWETSEILNNLQRQVRWITEHMSAYFTELIPL